MTKQIISGIMNAVIRKKLEKMVLDTMGHPEEVPENILDSREMAREMGLQDIVVGFDEILSEVGRIQIQRTIDRKRSLVITRREREFQDYLIAHPERLEGLEPGLKYKSHEKVIRAGRLDIEATDIKEKQTKIELKARDYDSKNVFMQIMKYFNDDETGEARVFFVAPEIKPNLFFALRHYQEAGRIKFFEHDNVPGEYNFKEIKASDFETPEQIDWSRRKRKPNENGLVRVTAAVGNGKSKRKKRGEAEESESFVDGEQIEAGSFHREWDSYPLYYQILMTNLPDLKDRKKYLNPIEILANQKDCLEALASNPDFELAKREFESHLSWYDSFMYYSGKQVKIPLKAKNLDKAYEKFDKGLKKGRKYENIVRQLITKTAAEMMRSKKGSVSIDKGLEVFEHLQRAFEKIVLDVKYKDKILIEFRRTLEGLAKDKSGLASGDYARGALFFNRFYNASFMEEFIKLKIARTKELAKIDENLARTYLSFNPANDPRFIESIMESEEHQVISLKLNPPMLYEFIKKDQELYQSILTAFKAKEEIQPRQEGQLEVITQTGPALVSKEPRQEEPKEPNYRNPQEIVGSIISTHKNNLTPDSQLRIAYFAEDMLGKYDDNELKQMHDELQKFNFDKRIRDRAHVSSEVQIRNFFDDITLQYVNNKKVPTKADLKRLYKQNCDGESLK